MPLLLSTNISKSVKKKQTKNFINYKYDHLLSCKQKGFLAGQTDTWKRFSIIITSKKQNEIKAPYTRKRFPAFLYSLLFSRES